MWRTLPLALVMLLTTSPSIAQTRAGSIRELSQAVASVEDWRAMGLFLMFVMLLLMGGSAWGRMQDRRSIDRLANALDRYSEKVTVAVDHMGEKIERVGNKVDVESQSAMLFQARMESVLRRLDDGK